MKIDFGLTFVALLSDKVIYGPITEDVSLLVNMII